jgi:hypothetical protein
MRFLRLSNSKETIYDSCLPDYFDVIDLESTDSGYKYRGEAVLRYDGDSDLIYETGAIFLSAVKQFPFEGNPKRRTQKTAALVSVADSGVNDNMSDPVDFTGVSLDPLDTVFLTRFAFVSRAPGVTKPNYGESFIPLSDPEVAAYDLSTDLVSSYFFTASDGGILYDVSTNSNNLDLTPTIGSTTHPTPTFDADTPVSNLFADGSLSFPVATYAAAVSLVAAAAEYSDHMMTSGGDDVAFTLSITFKLAAVGSTRVLIERSLFDVALTPDRRIEYTVFLDPQDRVHFRIYDDGHSTYKGAYTVTPVIGTGWTNVTVTYNGVKTTTTGAGMKIFTAGTERTPVDESSGHTGGQMYRSTSSRILVGAGRQSTTNNAPDFTTEFNGLIHALHIWKGRTLTASEARALSRAELSGVSNGIIKHRANFGLASYDGPLRRGTYRYGISNINLESTKSVFNSSHFGHARDALEQRKDTAFAGVKPPVTCKFLSGSQRIDPSLTHAQNISSFATSSLPYFDDGIARNRADDPDDDLTI